MNTSTRSKRKSKSTSKLKSSSRYATLIVAKAVSRPLGGVWDDLRKGFNDVILEIIEKNMEDEDCGVRGGDVLDQRTAPYFRSMLCNLRSFIDHHPAYFVPDTLGAAKSNPPSGEPPTAYASEAALYATFNQVGYDLAAISSAWRQRHLKIFKQPLQRADLVAAECVKRAVGAGLFLKDSKKPASKTEPQEPRPIVLTYFQKHPTIRMMPYTPVVLVGIPFSAYFKGDPAPDVTAHSDVALISIPHEVGHVVFWKGHNINGQQEEAKAKFACFLNRQYKNVLSLSLSSWTADGAEQIIADVFTARVTGAAGVLMAQERAEARQLDRYFADDLKYQVMPEVRPTIHTNVLKHFEDAGLQHLFEYAGKYWETQWQVSQSELLGNKRALKPYGSLSPISIKTLQAELDSATDYANRLLANVGLLTLDDMKPTSQVSQLRSLRERYLNLNDHTPRPVTDMHNDETILSIWRGYVNDLANVTPPDDYPGWLTLPDTAPRNVIETKAEDELGSFYSPLPSTGPVTCNNAVWDDYWVVWRDMLLDQEDKVNKAFPSDNTGYINAHVDVQKAQEWATLMYAGGWVTESSGNAGGPR